MPTVADTVSNRGGEPVGWKPVLQNHTPRLDGRGAAFPGSLNLARDGLLLASSIFVHRKFPCCGAKTHLHTNEGPRIYCSAAMRPLVALSAFLDVSSLNLAAPRAPPFFCVLGN